MLNNIQALRAIAALLVVLVHVGAIQHLAIPEMFAFGHAGVDLFFVVSGFVMVYTVANRPISPAAFFLNRIIRVVPLYWAFTFALFGAALMGRALMQSTDPTLSEFVKSMFFVPYRKADGLIQPVYFLGWTLNYEMAFYILFSFAIAIGRGSLARMVGIAMAAIIALACIGIVWNPSSLFLKFYTAPIVVEFAFGMGLAFAFTRGFAVSKLGAWVMFLAGSVGLIIYPLFNVPAHSLLLIPASGLIVAGAVYLEKAGQFMRNRYVLILGAASYSLYLSHPFATAIGDRLSARVPDSLAIVVALLFSLTAAIALSLLIHFLFERPVTAWLRKLIDHRPSAIARQEDAILAEAPTNIVAKEQRDGATI